MWTRSQILDLLSTKKAAIAVASVTAFASGAAGGYFFASKKLERKYQDIANEEIISAKLFYSKRAKEGYYSDPVVLAEQYAGDSTDAEEATVEVVDPTESSQADMIRGAIEILETQNYTNYSKSAHHEKPSQEEVSEVRESIKKNVFDTARQERRDFDAEAEQEKRDEGKPYIITISEFMGNTSRSSQMTVTYYEKDDVVANELDIPWEEYESRLGDDNLHFGCGSSDPTIVYIRNEDRDEEYEVIRSTGSFAQEVAGFSDDEPPRRRHHRDED